MDFIGWCDVFLKKLLTLQERDSNGPDWGITIYELGADMVGQGRGSMGFLQDPRGNAVMDAYHCLVDVGLIEPGVGGQGNIKVARRNRDLAQNQLPLWSSVLSVGLDDEETNVIQALVNLSERREPEHASLEPIQYERLSSALGLDPSYEAGIRIDRIFRALRQLNLARLARGSGMSDSRIVPTYQGLAWVTRRHLTESRREIDRLLDEGETPTVDFKRQLSLDTASDKAEFIKDVASLANTIASGKRFLLVGINNDGSIYSPVDPDKRAERDRLMKKLTRERLQTITAHYTTPALQISYDVIPFEDSVIGRIEVLRNAAEIPYRVKDSLGGKGPKDHRIEEGDVHLRDGTVSRKARLQEIEELEAAAQRTRIRRDRTTP